MNELFEPGEERKRLPAAAQAEIDYDDELDSPDPGYRYVIRRASADGPHRPARAAPYPER
jgi:hypothetical protein